MRGLHWVAPMGLPALPLCEFCKHKIVRPLPIPVLQIRVWVLQMERSIARMDAGPLKEEFQSLPALTCALLHSKAEICSFSNIWKKHTQTKLKIRRRSWPQGSRALSSCYKAKNREVARKSVRARSGLNLRTPRLTSLDLRSFISLTPSSLGHPEEEMRSRAAEADDPSNSPALQPTRCDLE